MSYRAIYDPPDDDSNWHRATRDPLVRPCIHCKTPVDLEPDQEGIVLCPACEALNAQQFEGRR